MHPHPTLTHPPALPTRTPYPHRTQLRLDYVPVLKWALTKPMWDGAAGGQEKEGVRVKHPCALSGPFRHLLLLRCACGDSARDWGRGAWRGGKRAAPLRPPLVDAIISQSLISNHLSIRCTTSWSSCTSTASTGASRGRKRIPGKES